VRRTSTLALLLFLVGIASHARAEPITVGVTAIQLDPDGPATARLGPLKFLAGLSLTSRDKRFGGLSGLLVERDQLTAVSDRGFWFRSRLELDEDGALQNLSESRISPILSSKGEPLAIVRGEHDAEALEKWGSSLAVSFERFHRVGLYDPNLGDSARPTYVRDIPGIAKSPPNGGIEVLVSLDDGRLLALTEESETDAGELLGWIIEGARRDSLAYPKTDWKPTDGAFHPQVGLLILERKFSALTGFSTRIRKTDIGSVVAGGNITGPIVARISGSVLSDNFEGIAISELADGSPVVWIISDDNFSFFQQTLLLAFRWAPE
jgi:hypothetical protein